MKDSITISPKYGLNPTMPICFFCGKPTGEIALMGHIKEKHNGRAVANSDIEAPHEMVLNYEPCDECKENMSKGITVIEATDAQNVPERPEIAPGAVPTGKWSVISLTAFKRIFKPMLQPEMYQKILSGKTLLLDTPVYENMFANVEE